MKKGFLFCCSIILLLVSTSYVHAKTIEVPLNDSYIKGVITTLESETMSAEENEIRTYSFKLDRPGEINLHFIAHINNMKFQIKDIDENVIEDDYIGNDNSPKDYILMLEEGTYTLHIIKIAPTGMMGVQMSDDNIGEYKFKIKYSPFIEENGANNVPEEISLDQVYQNFFKSKSDSNSSDLTEKNHKLNISETGTYTFIVSSNMALNYVIKDLNENVIGEGSSSIDDNSRQEFTLLRGTYDIICSTSEAGLYEILVESNVVETKDDEKNDTPQEEDTEKNSIIDKILSPTGFVGAILVAIIGGVISGIIVHRIIKR